MGNTQLTLAIATAVALFVSGAASPAVAACSIVSDPSQLIKSLHDGGYVLVIRHADKYADKNAGEDRPKRPKSLNRKLPASCSNPQDPQVLTDHGVRQAREIRGALRDVPISQIFASNACRTIETAEIAFGRAPERYGDLPQLLRSAPEPGANTAVVSHSRTIKESLDGLGIELGRKLSCGEAAIIDPDGDNGHPKCVALVLAAEWRPSSGDLGDWQNRLECDRRR